MAPQSAQIKLSPYQEVFYFEWLLNPDGNRFHIVFDQLLYGELEPERLKIALNRYVADHLILNSHIQVILEEPRWMKNKYVRPLNYIDYPISDSELFDEVSHPFDLHEEPLYRFILCYF